jgi:integrase
VAVKENVMERPAGAALRHKTQPSARAGNGPGRQHGSRGDPDAELQRLSIGTADSRRVLDALLRKHNHLHSKKAKGVSLKTMRDRSGFYLRFFCELRHETVYKDVDPRTLGGRHVQAMVQRWVQAGHSTATIHNYLSFLRTFAGWIGKPGMVLKPVDYVGQASPHAHRCQVAREDQSWSAHGVDVESMIAKVAAKDSWVGLQLELCARFGLRPKEARHFRPHEAIVSREQAIERDAHAFPEQEWFVRVHHGTKGGRPRDVPLTDEAQWALLQRCQASVAQGMYVGRPGYTDAQNRRRFYLLMESCGITRRHLGVVAHGLRHQFANDLYGSMAGGPSPVRGGQQRAPHDAEARAVTARALGHNRPLVTNCYLGGGRTVNRSNQPCATATLTAQDDVEKDQEAPRD